MKICILVQNLYSLGGIQRVVSTVVNELIKDKIYEITVLMPFDENNKNEIYDLDKRIKIKNLNDIIINKTSVVSKIMRKFNKLTGLFDFFHCFNLIEKLTLSNKNKKKLIDYLLIEKFDLAIGAGLFQTLQLMILSRKSNIKIIGWMHSTYNSYFKTRGALTFGYKNYFKKFSKNITKILVLSKKDAEDFKNELNVECITLYNPLDSSFFSGKSNVDNHKLLFVGRLDIQHKGLDYLLEILEILDRRKFKYKLSIVGDGPDKKILNRMIIRKKLSDKIEVVGAKKNIIDYYNDSRILLVPSKYEGFGMVIIEAMACGLPTIAFENNGPSEIINNQENGILVSRFDCDKFAEEIIDLYTNKGRWEYLSQKAKERAKDFSDSVFCEKFKKLISEGFVNE